MAPSKVLVTGAYGLIGGSTYLQLARQPEKYEVYGLARSRRLSSRAPRGRRVDIPRDRFFRCDIGRIASVRRAVEGMDVVVHLAADPSGENWKSVLHNNVIGAYNVFEACRQAQVGRVIAAGTVQVSEGHGRQEPYEAVADGRTEDVPSDFRPLPADAPAEPRNIYACGKMWVESLAQTYAHTHGMSCIVLRIGWVTAEDRPIESAAGASVWCSQRDVVQLVERCVDAPADLRFDVFYGVSEGARRWVDIDHARKRVGYVPQDRAEDHY